MSYIRSCCLAGSTISSSGIGYPSMSTTMLGEWSTDTQTVRAMDLQYEELQQYFESISYYLLLYGYPAVFIFGMFGNAISFTVMISKMMRNQSTTVFLAALALADTAVLLYNFIAYWYGGIYNKEFFLKDFIMTRAEMFWLRFPALTSSWLVVAVCAERFVVTWFPFKANVICRRKNAMITVCIVVSLSLAYAIGVASSSSIPSQRQPEVPGEDHFEIWVLTMLFSVLPIISLTGMSIAIAVNLRQMSALQHNMTPTMSPDFKSSTKATRVVMTVCVTFIILTLPGTILLGLYGELTAYNGRLRPEMSLVETISLIALMLNHSFNVVLYIASSSRFRKIILNQICSDCRKDAMADTSSKPSENVSMTAISHMG